MNRNLMIAGLAIVLLSAVAVVLVVLQLQTRGDLDDAHDEATQSANTYAQTLGDNQAAATQSAQDAAAVQLGLENDLGTRRAELDTAGTQRSNLEATATQGADQAAVVQQGFEAALDAQQAAYAAQRTVQSRVNATATQSAAEAAEVQAGLEDAIAMQETQQSHLAATGTQSAAYAAVTQVAMEQGVYQSAATQTAQARSFAMQSTAQSDQFATESAATQAAFEDEAAQDARDARATQTALNRRLATANAVTTDLEEENAALAATLSAETTYVAGLQATLDAAPLVPPTAAAPDIPAGPPDELGDEPVADVDVGDLIFQDDFNDDSLWPTGSLTSGNGRLELARGQYIVSVTDTSTSIEGMALPIITNAYVEAEVYFEDCPSDGLFSLSARVSDTGDSFIGYYFTVTCDLGYWAIEAYLGQGELNTLAYDSFTLGADEGARRHVLGTWLQGEDLRFYLDGVELGRTTSGEFGSGFIGVYAESVDNPLVVRLESVRVWRLP